MPYVLQPPILTSALQELGCLQAHRGLHGTHSRPVLACQTAPERLCNTCIGMPEPWWLLQATGSAPEVQTLPHLSQAKQDDCQAGSLEARRLKKDLQTLHTDPSTLGPTSYPQTAATAATIADSEQAAQQTTGVTSATELQLQAASPLVNPDQPVASTAAASADTAAAVTAVEGSAPADSTHADKPSAVTAVNDVVDVAEPEAGNDVAHAEGSEAVAADEDAVMPQALNVTQQDAEGSKVPDAPKDEAPPADAVLPLDTGVTDRQKEGDVHNRTEEEEQQVPGASDATCTETAVQQPVEDELQEEPQQSKIAASAKPKGKRKAAASLKGNAKRQKGKQDDREASPVPDKAAGKAAAPSQKEHADVAPVRAAAAAKPAASKAVAAQPVAAEAAATKQGGRTVKKGASSASGAGIKKAAAKPSDAATKKGGTATSGAKRKASAAALASDSDADDADNDKADHTAETHLMKQVKLLRQLLRKQMRLLLPPLSQGTEGTRQKRPTFLLRHSLPRLSRRPPSSRNCPSQRLRPVAQSQARQLSQQLLHQLLLQLLLGPAARLARARRLRRSLVQAASLPAVPRSQKESRYAKSAFWQDIMKSRCFLHSDLAQ